MAYDLDADTESFSMEFESEAPTPPSPPASPANSVDAPFNDPANYAIVPAAAAESSGSANGNEGKGIGKGGKGRGRGVGRGRGGIAPGPKAKASAKGRAKAKARAAGVRSTSNTHGYWRVVRDAVTNVTPYQPRRFRYELRDDSSARLLFKGYKNDPTFQSVELPAFEFMDQFAEDFIDVKSRFSSNVKVHQSHHDITENESNPTASSLSSLWSSSSAHPLPGLFRLFTCCCEF